MYVVDGVGARVVPDVGWSLLEGGDAGRRVAVVGLGVCCAVYGWQAAVQCMSPCVVHIMGSGQCSGREG